MTSVAFVVNGEPSSPMGYRARAFADRLRPRHEVRIFYRSRRKILSVFRLTAELLRWRPRVCYVLDVAYSGVGGGVLYKGLTGNRLVIDTGDAITELARSLGRGTFGIALTRALEGLAFAAADRVVVRGSGHKEWLAERGLSAEFIPDGVECAQVTPHDAADLRRDYGLDGVLTVGLVGSTVWSERLRSCYGWDLIEVIRLLKDQPIKGVLIGDGSGLPVLRARCREYDIEDRVLFLGRLPHEQLARHLGMIDVCLSTQTNDRVGQVRTTGKLPLYLAAGRYVLASRVGEAARVLDDDMLVDYEGTTDPDYPHKLAARLRTLLANRGLLECRVRHVGLAREQFDYDVLARRVEGIITPLSGRPRGGALANAPSRGRPLNRRGVARSPDRATPPTAGLRGIPVVARSPDRATPPTAGLRGIPVVARSPDRATPPTAGLREALYDPPVVARSPDRATPPTAGLREALYDPRVPGDLRSGPMARSGDRVTTGSGPVARSGDRATTRLANAASRGRPLNGRIRLAVLCDFPEEGWPSMDLAAEMLLRRLHGLLDAVRVCPPFRRRAEFLPGLARRRLAHNADRLLNRLWDYPRSLRHQEKFDLFHVCDHSYAQLVHVLPPGRTGVFCHDLDTFRCVLEPQRERRPFWFRVMARHILGGLQKAAVVFCATQAVRQQIEEHRLVDPARIVLAPYGVSEEFTAETAGMAAVTEATGGRPFVLHVGSSIARKRVDVLLDVFARLRWQRPDLLLVQVGGEWTTAQQEQIARLGLGPALIQRRGLERREVADFYRQAAVVLLPSEAEGFGLPVIEALACGAAVVASDLPVLREVGGEAVTYCPVADVAAWHAAVAALLADAGTAPSREARLARARRYSWEAQARTIAAAYQLLADSSFPGGAATR